jgi:hypothetical protein
MPQRLQELQVRQAAVAQLQLDGAGGQGGLWAVAWAHCHQHARAGKVGGGVEQPRPVRL